MIAPKMDFGGRSSSTAATAAGDCRPPAAYFHSSCVRSIALLSLTSLALAMLCFITLRADAQIVRPVGNAPGVYVDPDRVLKRRQIDEREELTAMRSRVRAAQDAGKSEKLAYVSLPKSFAAARVAVDTHTPIPDEIRYLGGLTQIKFIFLYPESNDLMIAGPFEPVDVIDDLHAVGKKTGRPVLRLEDLTVAMRVVSHEGRGAFGCRLDPDPAAPARIRDTMLAMTGAARAERVKAVARATGPQKVSFFGKVPDDTHFALVMIGADYELKRYGLGLAQSTVPDLGTIVDNSRAAVNMIWYELAYDAMLVSPEGDAYGLRGPRLRVQAGGFDWDAKGATPKAFEFAKKMSRSMETLAMNQPFIAELQNLADQSVLAALIHRDRLDEKVGWDASWLRREAGENDAGFPMARMTVPKTADALANYTNGSIAAGGVVLSPAKIIAASPEKDVKGAMRSAKLQGLQLRREHADATVLSPLEATHPK